MCFILCFRDIVQIFYAVKFHYIDWLVQEWRNPSALVMELRPSRINPSIYIWNVYVHNKKRLLFEENIDLYMLLL